MTSLGRTVVVGAAIIDLTGPRPRLLAAQRADPPALAGYWELPGGKVEAGETDEEALVRECAEELGVVIDLRGRVGSDLPIAVTGGGILRVWVARIVSGELSSMEHSELRWLTADELDDVAWLPADLALLPPLSAILAPIPHAEAG